VTRTVSTQKFPTVLADWRAMPRTSAAATAMPAAADVMPCPEEDVAVLMLTCEN